MRGPDQAVEVSGQRRNDQPPRLSLDVGPAPNRRPAEPLDTADQQDAVLSSRTSIRFGIPTAEDAHSGSGGPDPPADTALRTAGSGADPNRASRTAPPPNWVELVVSPGPQVRPAQAPCPSQKKGNRPLYLPARGTGRGRGSGSPGYRSRLPHKSGRNPDITFT